MAPKPLPDQDTLLKLLRYEPETGRLFWRRRSADFFASGAQSASHRCGRWNSTYAGTEAFTTTDRKGYRYGSIANEKMRAHRVIWKMQHGFEPAEIDHINGDPSDNRLSNLRASTRQQNGKNLAVRASNTSGKTGVRYHPVKQNWQAYICVNTRFLHLGCFATFEAAVAARAKAEQKYSFKIREA